MLAQEPVDFAIQLFTKLKSSNDNQRLELYNYQKIDLFLDWFFRSVIALEILKGESTSRDSEIQKHNNAFKILSHGTWGGGDQYESIAKYFGIRLVTIQDSTHGPGIRELREYHGMSFSFTKIQNSFGFLPATKHTHVISLLSSSHQEILERVTPLRTDRNDFLANVSCNSLKYLLEDNEIDENSTYDVSEALLGKEGTFLHLAAAFCRSIPDEVLNNKKTKNLINKKDSRGNTPWHYYALLNKMYDDKMHDTLIALGADLSIVNNENKLPVEMIFTRNNEMMLNNYVVAPLKKLVLSTPVSAIKKTQIKQEINEWLKKAIDDSIVNHKESFLDAAEKMPLK